MPVFNCFEGQESKSSVLPLPAFARLFLGIYNLLNRLFSLYIKQYAVYKAVYTTRTCCSVACSRLEKAVQKLVTDLHLDYLNVESPEGSCARASNGACRRLRKSDRSALL